MLTHTSSGSMARVNRSETTQKHLLSGVAALLGMQLCSKCLLLLEQLLILEEQLAQLALSASELVHQVTNHMIWPLLMLLWQALHARTWMRSAMQHSWNLQCQRMSALASVVQMVALTPPHVSFPPPWLVCMPSLMHWPTAEQRPSI